MSESQRVRCVGPPQNPALRDRIAVRRRYSPGLEEDERKGFRGWHERGYLPHCDKSGLTQFVTFRLGDSFPASRRSEWECLWKIIEDNRRREELETYLDKGRGSCYMRQEAIGDLVECALRYFHPTRYELYAWCVMPNHVHVLFKVSDVPMSAILESWKKYTSLKANAILKRRGRFWEADYWDTYMRDMDHQRETIRYIEYNPVKAGLVESPKDWPWSSARLRDEFGVLKM